MRLDVRNEGRRQKSLALFLSFANTLARDMSKEPETGHFWREVRCGYP